MSATQAGCEKGPTSGREAGRGASFVFFGAAGLLFTAATTLTILSCAAMATMGAVPMAGGWLLSGIWLPLCGQSWLETAACFVGMWFVMMVAMMLPSLAPVLWRYRNAAFAAGASRPGGLVVLTGTSYFAVWAGFGLLAFLIGAALAQIALQFPSLARLGPVAGGFVILIAGLSQFSLWKTRLLADCHDRSGALAVHPSVVTALGGGTALGLRCCLSCIAPMTVLIAGGLMDLLLMLCVTLSVTAERLMPPEMRIAQAAGAVMAGSGLFLLGRAL